eukprot:Clim_evm15s244 gene=Clim_evmTU15s244
MKKIRKWQQATSEKFGGNANKTQLEQDYTDMIARMDALKKLCGETTSTTHSMISPTSKGMFSKNNQHYESILGEIFTRGASTLPESSDLAEALTDAGEVQKQLGEARRSYEEQVTDNFLNPWKELQDKDLKHVHDLSERVKSKRLHYDAAKKKYGEGSAETNSAQRVFEDAKEQSWNSIAVVMNKEAEQIYQLQAFMEAQQAYFRAAVEITGDIAARLAQRAREAKERPPAEMFTRTGSFGQLSGGMQGSTSSLPHAGDSGGAPGGGMPCARAKFQFDAEQQGEISFREGDIITLTRDIDANWYEGEIHGQRGIFPKNFVETVTPL